MCESAVLFGITPFDSQYSKSNTMIASPEKLKTEESTSLYSRHAESPVDVEHLEFRPADLSELPVLYATQHRFLWPHRIWERLTPERKDRLIRILRHLIGRSYFTGVGGFEVLLYVIVTAVNEYLTDKIPLIEVTNATEMQSNRQLVLKAMDHGPHCIHGAIEERLPIKVWMEIKQIQDGIKAGTHDAARRLAYQKIDSLLSDCYNLHWDRCINGPCIVHGASCPVIANAEKVKDKLVVVGSGVVCKDASPMGLRKGDAGPAMVGQSIWAREMTLTRPAITFTECVQDWEPKVAAAALPSHRAYTCLLHPHILGDRYMRTRRMTTTIGPDPLPFFLN